MRRFAEAGALSLLVVAAVVLRGHNLGCPPLWTDEAESAINALAIVANGLPVDHFLGQPLYESTLVAPWPENPEYEFRDVNYSDKGVAAYHGWLPLYSIAAAFRLAGVTPEQARSGTPPRDASTAEVRHWTAVPRWPSLVFSAVFVVAAYGLGRAIHGASAGWALALAAATSDLLVWFGRQARYYSATLAGSAVCGLAIWNACRRGRMVDHALAGVAIGLLFHIHALCAVAMAGVYVVALPLARHQPRLWLRVPTAGTVAGLLVLPWAVWSGLLDRALQIPAARHYLDLPMLLRLLPGKYAAILALAGLCLAWLAAASLLGKRVHSRWRQPFTEALPGLYFAVVWLTLSYLAFVALVPAPSYFEQRLKLAVAVPGLLLSALVIATVSRAVRPSSSTLPLVGMAALLVLTRQVPPTLASDAPVGSLRDLVGSIRSWDLGAGGRVFASPNEHLILTYYSGRPVQSIAPIRKEWLDRFAADLVVIEGPWFEPLSIAEVQATARRLGRELAPEQAKSRADDTPRLAVVLDLLASGSRAVSPPPAPDDLDRLLVDALHRGARSNMERLVGSTPFGRVAAPSNWREWRHAFFYWFSDPHRREGVNLNYRACRDSAVVHVHPSGFVVFDCRRIREPPLITTSSTSRAMQGLN